MAGALGDQRGKRTLLMVGSHVLAWRARNSPSARTWRTHVVVLVAATALMAPTAPLSNPPPGSAPLHSIAEGFAYGRTHTVAQAVYLVDLSAMVFGPPRAFFPALALNVYHGSAHTRSALRGAGWRRTGTGGRHRVTCPRP